MFRFLLWDLFISIIGGPCNQVFSVYWMVSIFSSNPSFSFHPLMTDLLLIMELKTLPDPKPKQPHLPPKSGCSRELFSVGNGGGRGLVSLQRCTQTNPTQLWKQDLTISLIISWSSKEDYHKTAVSSCQASNMQVLHLRGANGGSAIKNDVWP